MMRNPKSSLSAVIVLSLFTIGALLFVVRRTLAAPASVTFTVNSTADAVDDNPGNGICHTAAGACTLRAAIMEADESNSDVTIDVPAGTYRLTILPIVPTDTITSGDLNLTPPLSGNPIITISGAGSGQTIIDGNQIDRVFWIDSGRTAVIKGVTLRNGDARKGGSSYRYGGGIKNDGTLTLDDSQVISNTGIYGGGIDNQGLLRVANDLISGNLASANGGGIDDWSVLADSVLVTNTTIANNTANNGGGLERDYVGSGRLRVVDSAIYSNTAIYNGGAVDLGFYYQGDLYLVNSTVSHNRAAGDGGGIAIEGASPNSSAWLYNDTIAYNHAGANLDVVGKGGGIASIGTAVFTSQYTILAWNTDVITTVFNNIVITLTQGNECYGSFGYEHEDIMSQYDTLRCHPTALIVHGDPKIDPLRDNGGSTWTHALLKDSPAIDQGLFCTDDQGYLLMTDQRGFARFTDGACDIGAYEYPDNWLYLPSALNNH